MASVNRTAVLTKLHKVLKKHYQPTPPPPPRPLLDNLLFACVLENAPQAAAEQAFQLVSTSFFDWNEVRVSTAKELSEVMKMLPDPVGASNNLKRALQGIFEGTYSFDLETLKKMNLGAAVQKLEKCECSAFVVSYVVQTSLGGHSIPLDTGAMGVLAVLGLVPEGSRPREGCSGLERAIPKNKGMEFGSLLHQPAVEYFQNPYSPKLHALLLEVDPEAKSRLPKRQPKVTKVEPPPAPPQPTKPEGKIKPTDAKPDAKVDAKGKSTESKKPDDKKKEPIGKKPAAAPTAKKPTPAPAKKSSLPAKKPLAKVAAPTAKRKPR